jgi:hypothetical protein
MEQADLHQLQARGMPPVRLRFFVYHSIQLPLAFLCLPSLHLLMTYMFRRYLSRFHHEASLAAPEAQNAVTECQKYPSIARVVVDVSSVQSLFASCDCQLLPILTMARFQILEEERDARPISVFP